VLTGKSAKTKRADGGSTDLKIYVAVSIVSRGDCCASVKALNGQRILAAAAPKLPLENCSTPFQCRCRFEKYSDRRENDEGRRFDDASERAAWYSGQQRRKGRGRRRDE